MPSTISARYVAAYESSVSRLVMNCPLPAAAASSSLQPTVSRRLALVNGCGEQMRMPPQHVAPSQRSAGGAGPSNNEDTRATTLVRLTRDASCHPPNPTPVNPASS